MRRRHLRVGVADRGAGVPDPWTHGLFVSELALRSSRVYVIARVGREVIGYARADDVADRRSRHHDRGRSRLAAPGRRDAAAARARPRGDRAQCDRAHARGPALAPRRRSSCTSVSASRPVGVRKGYYADTGEDALIMWAHDVDSAEYAALLDRARTSGVPRHDRARPSRRAGDRCDSRDRDVSATRPRPRSSTTGARYAVRRSSRVRSTCTRATAAWCPRSRAAPTWSSSTT